MSTWTTWNQRTHSELLRYLPLAAKHKFILHSYPLLSVIFPLEHKHGSDLPRCSDTGRLMKSALINHPVFIQSVIIADTSGVIIIIHERLGENSNVWMHTGAISLFQQALHTISPTQIWSAGPIHGLKGDKKAESEVCRTYICLKSICNITNNRC